MKYNGLRIYDMEESIVASGFPMLKKKYSAEEYEGEVINLRGTLVLYGGDKILNWCKASKEEVCKYSGSIVKSITHMKRVLSLGNARQSSGHDCFEKGIVVNINIEADQSFWLQWERYHYQDTISSMSTMHCLTKFNLNDNLFSEYTDQRAIDLVNEKIVKYNKNPTSDNFHEVIHNCPEGIELCRRISTNYLQLKTMYKQRENHKMYAWSKDFTEMCDGLPYFKELCLGGNNNE